MRSAITAIVLTISQSALATEFDIVGFKLGSDPASIEKQLLEYSNRNERGIQRIETKINDDPSGWIEESAHLNHMLVSGMRDESGKLREEMIRVVFHRKPADEKSAAIVRSIVPRGNEPTLDSVTASLTEKYGQPTQVRERPYGALSEVRYTFGDARKDCADLMMDSFEKPHMSVEGFDSRSIKQYLKSKEPRLIRDEARLAIKTINDCSASLLFIINHRDNSGKSVSRIRSALVDIGNLIESNDSHGPYWDEWRDEFIKNRAENASAVKF